MSTRLVAAAVAALLFGAAHGAHAATVYRCDAPGATPTFQQHPCTGPGQTLDVRPAQPVGAAPRTGAAEGGRRTGAADGGRPRPGTVSEGDALLRYGPPTRTNIDYGSGSGVARHHLWRYPDGSSRSVKTRDGVVVAVREHGAPRRSGRVDCPSALTIRAERVSASSLTLSAAERSARARRIDEMERCGRPAPGAGRRTTGRR